MSEGKCPACRKRFSSRSCPGEVCARCGADLSLLLRLRRRADQLAVRALAGAEMEPQERVRWLKQGQALCQQEEVAMLMHSLRVTDS